MDNRYNRHSRRNIFPIHAALLASHDLCFLVLTIAKPRKSGVFKRKEKI